MREHIGDFFKDLMIDKIMTTLQFSNSNNNNNNNNNNNKKIIKAIIK